MNKNKETKELIKRLTGAIKQARQEVSYIPLNELAILIAKSLKYEELGVIIARLMDYQNEIGF